VMRDALKTAYEIHFDRLERVRTVISRKTH
jgi:hypothetical protein